MSRSSHKCTEDLDVNNLLLLSDFSKLGFLNGLWYIYIYIYNFTEIRSEGTELFHADRRTDIKLRVAFRNSTNMP
jgi:hypothetical protein